MPPTQPSTTAQPTTQVREALQQHAGILADLQADLLERELTELSLKTYKRPLVLFFGRTTFCDNTKYLYLEAVRSLQGFDVMWCTATPSLAAELRAHELPVLDMSADHMATVRELLQCSVAVFCENMLSTFAFRPALAGALAGAQKLQLWHGVSVKPLDLMLLPHGNILENNFRRTLRNATRPDAWLSTSSVLDPFWVRAHGGTQLIRAGQPRNEVLLREPTEQELIGASLSPSERTSLLNSGKTRMLVAPTWKRGAGLFTSTPAFHKRLEEWAAANNAVVFVKSHPFMRGEMKSASIPGRLHFLEAGVDVYPWLSHFDALITDYSSIMFDFLLTGKPIFTFDTTGQHPFTFEPDWSLIPDTPFRYEFTADTLEAVLKANVGTHPLSASQELLVSQLYECDPQQANADLLRVIQACHEASVHRPVDVVDVDPEVLVEAYAG
jgi:CDP-glycerol glycerophosphotransferase